MRLVPPRWGVVALALLVWVWIIAACAREEAPPGSGPDFEAPRVVELHPQPRTVVPGFDGEARVRFDEPLADSRSIERLLQVSPADRIRVKPGRRDVRIRPEAGWRPNAVYYLRIQPGIADLLRNRTDEPIELLFSTGPGLTNTRAEGRLYDRLRAQTVRGGRILFLGADSVPYTAVSDTGGVFSLPSLPPGAYTAFGFLDQNSNLRLDRDFEPHDSAEMVLADSTSRTTVELWMTAPDSTPPFLAVVEAVRPNVLQLEFDEPLDPERPIDLALVTVRHRETGEGREVVKLSYGSAERNVPAPAPPPGDRPPEPDELEGDEADDLTARSPDASLREVPFPFVTAELATPLTEGRYDVTAQGFANLRGLVGGGDTTFVFETPPDTVPADAVPDTSGASSNGRTDEDGRTSATRAWMSIHGVDR